jgi:hypothetical protein
MDLSITTEAHLMSECEELDHQGTKIHEENRRNFKLP